MVSTYQRVPKELSVVVHTPHWDNRHPASLHVFSDLPLATSFTATARLGTPANAYLIPYMMTLWGRIHRGLAAFVGDRMNESGDVR